MSICKAEDLPTVALTTWKEARGQGELGMFAVTCVIFNRAEKWNKSLHDICYQRNQFTSMSVLGDPEYNLEPAAGDKQYTFCLTIATAMNEGQMHDITGGSLYYYNPKTANSEWFTKNIAGDPLQHPLKATIRDQEYFA